jgi:transposase
MHVIGEETSERLDVIPAQFQVIVTHRRKFACRACEEAVVQAPAPERLIKGGLPTEAMVAYVLVAKYAWHLPLYRQAQMSIGGNSMAVSPSFATTSWTRTRIIQDGRPLESWRRL